MPAKFCNDLRGHSTRYIARPIFISITKHQKIRIEKWPTTRAEDFGYPVSLGYLGTSLIINNGGAGRADDHDLNQRALYQLSYHPSKAMRMRIIYYIALACQAKRKKKSSPQAGNAFTPTNMGGEISTHITFRVIQGDWITPHRLADAP
jgi:ribosomal protein S17E